MTGPSQEHQELARPRPRARLMSSFRRMTSPLRRPPSFLIIGAQKGGTTTLFDYLVRHPQVAAPRAKELHYFDLRFDLPYKTYLSEFPLRGRVSGEASPYYLFHPWVPARVAQVLPDVKLMVMLRDPVARAMSHHNHNVALGIEELPLEEAFAAEEERLAGEAERLADPRANSVPHRHFSYLARGRYDEQLERWYECFPREQMLILSSEEFFADPLGQFREALRFLALPEFDPGGIEAHNARAYAPMPVALRARLETGFAPHNERLHALTGRDFGW